MATNKKLQKQQVAAAEVKTMFASLMAEIAELKARPQVSVWDKELWTVKDLSEATGWATATIYAKVNANELPYYKPGKTLFFIPGDVKAYIVKHKVRSNVEINEIATSKF